MPAAVILERLSDHGYDGGSRSTGTGWPRRGPCFGSHGSAALYLPGEIGQVDWWDLGVEVPVGKDTRRDVSAIRSLSTPRTRRSGPTTAIASVPILHVPAE